MGDEALTECLETAMLWLFPFLPIRTVFKTWDSGLRSPNQETVASLDDTQNSNIIISLSKGAHPSLLNACENRAASRLGDP